jgi:sugar/nucleoside kinase (ribokinase family)
MVNKSNFYDLAIIGNYTKDTIVSTSGTRYFDGGGFYYGAFAAAMLGLKIVAVTRLAKQDFHVVNNLKQRGVDVFVTATPSSTHIRLEYPNSNVDERILYVTNTAGAFTSDQLKGLEAKAFLFSPSIKSEVNLEVITEARKKDTLLVADVQGFVRATAPDGKLIYEEWLEKSPVLSQLDILKTDAVEAEMLTGESDIKTAARKLADLGPKEVVLTHRHGVLVCADGKFHEAAFFPKELVGRSGRGDTCIASYVGKRLTASPAEATIWAAAVTSLKMESEGPIRREIDEVEALIRSKYNG